MARKAWFSWSFSLAVGAAGALVAGCGGDDPAVGTGGSTSASTSAGAAQGGGGAGATSSTTGSGGSTTSGAQGGGGAGGCEVKTSKEIGPNGGRIDHCGASLEVPPGAIDAPTTFSIRALAESPAPPPFERELSGPVFAFEPIDVELAKPVHVTLPHENKPESRFEIARYIDDPQLGPAGFYRFEACVVTDTTIGQSVAPLGTFVALRDLVDYPDASEGLGDGAIEATFLAEPMTFDLDGLFGFGIYQSSPDGARTVKLKTTRAYGAEDLEQLEVDFALDAAGTSGLLVQVNWLRTGANTMGFSYIEGLVGEAGSMTVAEEAGRLVGTITATLASGDKKEPFTATFDVAVEKYAFPPELSCIGDGTGGG